MDKNKILDLRFVIGAFFTIISILLLVYSFTTNGASQSVNRWCGTTFLIFGVAMIILSFAKDADDEII